MSEPSATYDPVINTHDPRDSGGVVIESECAFPDCDCEGDTPICPDYRELTVKDFAAIAALSEPEDR